MFHLMDTEFVLSAALLAVLVILLFMYGFHGILKFNSGINYIMAIMFAVLAALACVGVVMAGIKYISDEDMKKEDKEKARKGMMMMAVAAMILAIVALLKYNYAKLFAALNKTLPENKSKIPSLGRRRRRRR